jgi:type IV pilus assembly protein PilV
MRIMSRMRIMSKTQAPAGVAAKRPATKRTVARRRACAVPGAESAFGLLETLIALLVISLGMLGVAALFTHGLLLNRVALARTQAVSLAADMAERIRGNRLGSGAYAAASADHGCEGADAVHCSPEQMAMHDIHDWSARVASTLPGGSGSVHVAGAAPVRYTIRVAWREPGMAARGDEQDYSVDIAVTAQ